VGETQVTNASVPKKQNASVPDGCVRVPFWNLKVFVDGFKGLMLAVFQHPVAGMVLGRMR